MIESIEKKLCTGCYSCSNICPQNCIVMSEDEEGFVYPKVDESVCLNCRMCMNTCPSLNRIDTFSNFDTPKVYAAWSLDEEVRYHSTSGGIFTELAKKILQNNGCVAGARYNDKHTVEHFIIEEETDIPILRQSKYIQSEVGFIYKDLKKELDTGKLVMFCGTPCQAAGLLSYLKKNYENLIICDFVCRGANSPKVYIKYLEMLEKKHESKVKKVWFKNKTFGWNRFSTMIQFENGKEYIQDRYTDLFMKGYIEQNLYMRPCCGECRYKSIPRKSDISLADFWGISAYNPNLDPDKGTSLVFINSNRGDKYFDLIKNNIFVEQSTLNAALPGNYCILKSVKMNKKRQEFFKSINELPFDEVVTKYTKVKFSKKAYIKARKILSKLKCKFLK